MIVPLKPEVIQYFTKNEEKISDVISNRYSISSLQRRWGYQVYEFEDITFSSWDFYSFLKYKDIYTSPLYSALCEEN